MEAIIKNPGLQHIVEEIFLHLDFKDILNCSLVNRSCRNILRNPIFWLKKCLKNGLLKKHHGAWARAIQLTMKTKYQKFQKNLKWNLVKILKRHFKDIPCFIDVKSIGKQLCNFTKFLLQKKINKLIRSRSENLKKYGQKTR